MKELTERRGEGPTGSGWQRENTSELAMPFCILAGRYGTSRLQTGGEESQLVPWLGSLGIDQGLESRVSTELATTVMTGLPWADSGEAVIAAMRQLGRPHSLTIAYRPDLASRGYGVLLWDLWDRHGWEGGNLLGRLLVSSAPMEVEARGHNSQGVE